LNIDGRKTAVCDVLLRMPQTLDAQTWENTMMRNIEALSQVLQ
jgi:hypothetical protein